MTTDKGFIKLSRKFFSNYMWNGARTFSSCEAWLDLIQSARFDAKPHYESIGGREVVTCRGQYVASTRYLAKRWHWGERRVRIFINQLKKEKMISVGIQKGLSVITLLNYDLYNPADSAEPSSVEVAGRQSEGHTRDTNPKKEEEREETNSVELVEKTAAGAALHKRKERFYESLVPYVPQYGREMVRAFFDYWSEPNRSGTKMLWELQRTWELSRRLARWHRNGYVFNKSKSLSAYEQKQRSAESRKCLLVAEIAQSDRQFAARQGMLFAAAAAAPALSLPWEAS